MLGVISHNQELKEFPLPSYTFNLLYNYFQSYLKIHLFQENEFLHIYNL